MSDASQGERSTPGVSVVMTVYNEAGNIAPLLDALLEGSTTPDQVVVADGGSTDGTLEILRDYQTHHPDVDLVQDGGDRASGRNAAVRKARFDRLAVIDGGCLPRDTWLERLVEAFDGGAEWVGGFYEPVGRTRLATAIGLTMVYVREEAERHFVPSARSLGFTRRLWEEVGGFPEGLQFAEDTLFAEELFRRGHQPVFAPEAIVEWHPPETLGQQARTMFHWGHGDGLQGLRSRYYLKLLVGVGATLAIAAVGASLDPGLAMLGLVPPLVFVVGNTRDKYRHMTGAPKWIMIPVAAANGAISSLLGFLLGRQMRRRSLS